MSFRFRSCKIKVTEHEFEWTRWYFAVKIYRPRGHHLLKSENQLWRHKLSSRRYSWSILTSSCFFCCVLFLVLVSCPYHIWFCCYSNLSFDENSICSKSVSVYLFNINNGNQNKVWDQFKVNNKHIGMTSLTLFGYLHC